MKVNILGAGWYGCHIASALIMEGHDVQVYDPVGIFAGASGANPARLHVGWHYPRSKLTRQASQTHAASFMAHYRRFTRGIRTNIYAVAAEDSLMDFGAYLDGPGSELLHAIIPDPARMGLQNVEGAVLTDERHIVISDVRTFFWEWFSTCDVIKIGLDSHNPRECQLTVDCTFGAKSEANIDRYEPCVMGLVSGPTDTAVTIMDGPFPSLYPWNEDFGLCSLTSAKYTPLAKCDTREEACKLITELSDSVLRKRCLVMERQLEAYYPAYREKDYKLVGYKTGVRAMPKSAAAARLVDVVPVGTDLIRIRAGKIDAIILAEEKVKEHIRRYFTI